MSRFKCHTNTLAHQFLSKQGVGIGIKNNTGEARRRG